MNFGEGLMYVTSFFGLFTSIYFLFTLLENKKFLKNPAPLKEILPKVSVIVPAFNEEDTIEDTIKSLLNLDYPKEKLDIYIIDDGSSDKTYEVSKKFAADNVFVYHKENGGKASALNFALKKADSEFVASLDADSFVSPDALKKMIGYFNSESVMAVTPSLKVYKARTILQKVQRIEYLFGIFLRKVFAFLGCIHVTPGPFTVYRKSFFINHGGYDENNLTEDIEVALRIQHHQYVIENSVNASVYTVSPTKWKTLLKQRLRWYVGFTENVIRYKHIFSAKHGQLGLFILPASFLSVILAILTLGYMFQQTIRQNAKALMNMYSVDFDILSFIRPNTDLFFMNINTLTFIGVFAVTAGIIIIWSAKKISEEKESIKFSYVLFMVLYWALFAFWWFMAWFYKIIGKKISWGHKSAKGDYRPDIS